MRYNLFSLSGSIENKKGFFARDILLLFFNDDMTNQIMHVTAVRGANLNYCAVQGASLNYCIYRATIILCLCFYRN